MATPRRMENPVIMPRRGWDLHFLSFQDSWPLRDAHHARCGQDGVDKSRKRSNAFVSYPFPVYIPELENERCH